MIASLCFLAVLLALVALVWRFALDPDGGGYVDGFFAPGTWRPEIDKVAHFFGGAAVASQGAIAGVPALGALLATGVTLVAYELQQARPYDRRTLGYGSWRDVVAGGAGATLAAASVALFGALYAREAPPPRAHTPRVVTRIVYEAAAAVDSAKRESAATGKAAAFAVDSATTHRRKTAPVRADTTGRATWPAAALDLVALDSVQIRLDSIALVRDSVKIAADSVTIVRQDSLQRLTSARADTLATSLDSATAEVPKAEKRGARRGFRRGLKVGSVGTLVAILVVILL